MAGFWRSDTLVNLVGRPRTASRTIVLKSAALVRLGSADTKPAEIRKVVYLQPGQGIGTTLIHAGIVDADATQAAHMVDAAIFPNRVPSGTALVIVDGAQRASGKRLLQELSLRPSLSLLLAIGRNQNGLALTSRPIFVDATPLQLAGTVGTDFARSLVATRAPTRVIADVLKLKSEHLGPGMHLRPFDRFELVFEQSRASDGRVETGALLYMALRRGDLTLIELVRWRDDPGLTDIEQGRQAESGRSNPALPVLGHLTSRYGLRFHPILGYTRLHAGVDIAAPWGAPVVAARQGTVTFSGWQGGHGNYVRLDHGAGLATGYAHLSRIAVVTGQRIATGQRIGYIGSTGLSTGPHLHYEVFRNGHAVDPLRQGVFAGSHADPPSQAFAGAIASLRSLIKTP